MQPHMVRGCIALFFTDCLPSSWAGNVYCSSPFVFGGCLLRCVVFVGTHYGYLRAFSLLILALQSASAMGYVSFCVLAPCRVCKWWADYLISAAHIYCALPACNFTVSSLLDCQSRALVTLSQIVRDRITDYVLCNVYMWRRLACAYCLGVCTCLAQIVVVLALALSMWRIIAPLVVCVNSLLRLLCMACYLSRCCDGVYYTPFYAFCKFFLLRFGYRCSRA